MKKILITCLILITGIIIAFNFFTENSNTENIKPPIAVDLVKIHKELERTNPQVLAHISALKTNANNMDLESQIALGDIYTYGRWVKADPNEALKWYKIAAENGNPEAQSKIGNIYLQGKYGLQENDTEAVKWYRRAALQGNKYAQKELGRMYNMEFGGLKKDLVTVYMWRKLGGDKSNDLYKIEAEMTSIQLAEAKQLVKNWKPTSESLSKPDPSSLIEVPELPKRVPLKILSDEECQNSPTDEEYIILSAQAGDTRAQFKLGFKYMEDNISEAIKWFTNSAEAGLDISQVILGKLYASDLDETGPYGRTHEKQFAESANLPLDYKKAAIWFKKSAIQGNIDAQYFLSLLYLDGKGVRQDSKEAFFWLGLVHKRYANKYPDLLLKIQNSMTKEQIEDVEKRIKKWAPVKQKISGARPRLNVHGLLCGKSKRGCAPVDQCGDIVGIDCGSAGDGPYYFTHTKTKDIIGSCSFWKSADTQSPCQPPDQWTCGYPKNYN